ncbi:MAG: hypothetical protein XD93_0790 [candidate division WS6 bacterium 34_10]|uniref:Uncharacterized protein n=1 Tax=candidate division WS6 bacterium 34_10 TaxID=1641389 RepID=A0A101HGY9_9BACT|nr:MAG: hypothetical protein XD93_0790 [candidate division WS6 bacterium 34_10]
MEKEINIQWSSSSLANTKEGLFTAAETTINSLISKEFYTNTVFDNAEKFALETREVLPDSTFGVSILPTMMSKRNLGEFVEYIENGSIDIPYIINWLKLPKEKAQELISQNGIGLDTALTYGLEIAYAMMQASSKKELERKVNESLALFPEDSPVTMRTCIENFSNEKVIDVVNELSSRNRNVKYALEPNVKLVNTLSEYIAYIDQLRKDNPELDIGLDLDLIHLNEERNLLEILDRLEGSKHFPLMISLGGAVLSEENVKLNTHLPLNLQDDTTVKKLGEYYSKLRFRNEKLPSLIFETSPAEKTLFESYQDFLKSFSEGLN